MISIQPVVRIMIFVIRPTTEVVDDLTWCCLLMRRWRCYSVRVSKLSQIIVQVTLRSWFWVPLNPLWRL